MILFSTFCKMPKGKIYYRVTFPDHIYKHPLAANGECKIPAHHEDFVSKSSALKASARYECIGLLGEVSAVAKDM